MSVSASTVAPTPRPPELDELLEELELLLEELELEDEDELALLEALELLEELEELEEELDELGLEATPPQAVRLPTVKHTRPALSKVSRVLPEVSFCMYVTLWNGSYSSSGRV